MASSLRTHAVLLTLLLPLTLTVLSTSTLALMPLQQPRQPDPHPPRPPQQQQQQRQQEGAEEGEGLAAPNSDSSTSSLSLAQPNDTVPVLSDVAGVEVHGRGGVEEEARGGEDGGRAFESLDSMLAWAIEHSDPNELQNVASATAKLSAEELAIKRQHIRDVVDAMKMPSDAEMMKVAIADLVNVSASVAQKLHALEELLYLVEPIDNANDLDKVGGLAALKLALRHDVRDVRVAAAWVVGKAAQNNPTVQRQIMQHSIGGILMSCLHRTALRGTDAAVAAADQQPPPPSVQRQCPAGEGESGSPQECAAEGGDPGDEGISRDGMPAVELGRTEGAGEGSAVERGEAGEEVDEEEEAVKCIYAVSATVRNTREAREWFYAEGGVAMLTGLLSQPAVGRRLKRKAVFLVADLAEQEADAHRDGRGHSAQGEEVKSVRFRLGDGGDEGDDVERGESASEGDEDARVIVVKEEVEEDEEEREYEQEGRTGVEGRGEAVGSGLVLVPTETSERGEVEGTRPTGDAGPSGEFAEGVDTGGGATAAQLDALWRDTGGDGSSREGSGGVGWRGGELADVNLLMAVAALLTAPREGEQEDLDLLEKTLYALRGLLRMGQEGQGMIARYLRDACGLEVALAGVGHRLGYAMRDALAEVEGEESSHLKSYLAEVEQLRTEVAVQLIHALK